MWFCIVFVCRLFNVPVVLKFYWTGKGQFQNTTRELTISKSFTITEPKNNSYNTEKLL